MVKTFSEIKEAGVILGIMERKLFKNNQSLIGCDVGPPGTGKSYRALRRMELWYKKIKRPFDIKNICFSPEEVLERLNSGELTRGDMLDMEEGGVNQGNLDFQTASAKIFNYITQSFRSLGIILFINLPYFSMLNKNTRMLCGYMEESVGIDKVKKQSIAKPFLLQSNQESGKTYRHYPKLMIDNSWEKIEMISYNLPSKEIRDAYELRKEQFVRGLISGGLENIQNPDKKRLTPFQMQIWSLLEKKYTNMSEVARLLGCSPQKVHKNIKYMQGKGYIADFTPFTPFSNPPNLTISVPNNSTTDKEDKEEASNTNNNIV